MVGISDQLRKSACERPGWQPCSRRRSAPGRLGVDRQLQSRRDLGRRPFEHVARGISLAFATEWAANSEPTMPPTTSMTATSTHRSWCSSARERGFGTDSETDWRPHRLPGPMPIPLQTPDKWRPERAAPTYRHKAARTEPPRDRERGDLEITRVCGGTHSVVGSGRSDHGLVVAAVSRDAWLSATTSSSSPRMTGSTPPERRGGT